MSLKTSVAGIELNGYVFNASGPDCTSLDELNKIGGSESSVIMMKSCTLEPREGNPRPRYTELELGSINSMGLPNLGYEKYLEFTEILKSHGKPVATSISGLCKEDFVTMIKDFQGVSVDFIEANFSCPNVPGKPQIGYDIEAVDELLSMISDLGDKPLGIKLPPYFDLAHYDEVAKVISKYNVKFLSCINSVGNTLVIDPESEKPVIKPKGGFGGLGGEYVKPVALANVRRFYELLGDRLDIVGVGGVCNGIDAFEFLLAGASSVQVATQFAKEGPECFARINNELERYLTKKGYKSIDEAKGMLKEMD